MTSLGEETPILIKTKLHRPRLGQDLIGRPQLIQRLNDGVERKFTLISAQAGAGKSTLLAQWLEQCLQPSAWLSLNEDDNNLMVFVGYLCAAIQTVFPDACERALDLLNAPVTPPPRIITTALVNELVDLCDCRNASGRNEGGTHGLIIALDDYHIIKEPSVHELVSDLLAYLPQCVHLTLSTRTDPPLPLAGLRARRAMTELRTHDLQLSVGEAEALLESTAGRKLNDATVNLLWEKTEGWVVGLRLAALSIRDLPDDRPFVERLEGSSSSFIADYLISEVLTQQSPAYQDFLLQSSILNRFNAELCDAVIWTEADTSPATPQPSTILSAAILNRLRSSNLFVIPLDMEGRWYRYHPLFQDILRRRLQRQHDPEQIRTLHSRASQWFETNGLVEEALDHAFWAGDLSGAARIVAQQRYRLMNQTKWQLLEKYLRRFPVQFVSQEPDLLMLNAWLVYHHGHYDQLDAATANIETALRESALPPDEIRLLKGEISALVSLLSYYRGDVDNTVNAARFCLKNTPSELWIVRSLARLSLAGAYQMRGEVKSAHQTILQAFDEETIESNRFKATTLMTLCFVYFFEADLIGLHQVANKSLELLDGLNANEIKGYVHYNLGRAHYLRNEISEAEAHFATVVAHPHVNYGDCFVFSACGLGLTYLAQHKAGEARETAAFAVAHMLETSNMTLLPVAQAFQIEVALREGKLAIAEEWAAQFDSIPPLSSMVNLYQYHFTLARIWLTQHTPSSLELAGQLLTQLINFTKATHNKIFLIEALTLQAMLRRAEDDEPAALDSLEQALELAQLGGIVRPFVDLGPPMAALLRTLRDQGTATGQIDRMLNFFPKPDSAGGKTDGEGRWRSSLQRNELLTARQLDVLELLAQRLSNKEIAEILFISPATVKTHALNIYAKLGVHSRQQAVKKAREFRLLSPY